MTKLERFSVCAAIVVSTFAIVRAQDGGVAAPSQAIPREPVAARIATCDVYAVMQVLVESERYKPARLAEQDKARAQLKEIAEQVRAIEARLKGMDPGDEKTLEVFREFNAKKELFQERQGELDEFLGNQFVTAYEEVRKAADAVGERRGYTHVIATRKASEKPAADMDRITQQVLSRPVLRSPPADDITEDVLAELKL